jgi:hypothetical protein
LILAADFLAGSILSLVLPVCVLLGVGVWYALLWRRGAGRS